MIEKQKDLQKTVAGWDIHLYKGKTIAAYLQHGNVVISASDTYLPYFEKDIAKPRYDKIQTEADVKTFIRNAAIHKISFTD